MSHEKHSHIDGAGHKVEHVHIPHHKEAFVAVPATEMSMPSTSVDKKALLIGINYIGTSYRLRGCVNDLKNLKTWLITEQGYPEANITVMSDDINGAIMPTKQNMLREIQTLVNGATAGAERFFGYSGHGGTAPDPSGFEDAGFCETICPLDDDLLDVELRTALVDPMPADSSLFCIFDSCHSGTILDLRYNCAPIKQPNFRSKAIYEHHPDKNCEAYLLTSDHYTATNGEVVVLSGCQDNQTSADAFIDNKNQGALVGNFIKVWNKLKTTNKPETIYNLITTISTDIKQEGYSQVPHLASGTYIDIHAALFD